MATSSLRNLERTTLRARALAAMRESVMSGEFEPGHHLSEVDLAESFGISRGTVREALRHLQQEGLVVTDERGRLRVRSVSGAEVAWLYEVRTALESLAIRRIMDMTGVERAKAVVKLDDSLQTLRDSEGDVAAQVEADLHLHQTLCEASGNPVLVETWKGLEGLVRATIYRVGVQESLSAMGPDRHADIVDAIARLSADDAIRLLSEHMQVAAERLGSALDS